jgi:FtsH-binding integral membrane protein
MDALTLGTALFLFNDPVALQALLITLGIFFGLLLLVLQSKYDFSSMCPWLLGGLIALSKPQTHQQTESFADQSRK